jgi:hypothetical protein
MTKVFMTTIKFKHFYYFSTLLYFIGGVFFFSTSLISLAMADECKNLIPLYQQSLQQLKDAETTFLKESCLESSRNKKCQELSSAVREIQGILQMFTARLKVLQCNPNKQQLNPCQKFTRIQLKAKKDLQEIERQSRIQRCHQRRHSPPCRALQTSQQKPRSIMKAVRAQLKKHKCKAN